MVAERAIFEFLHGKVFYWKTESCFPDFCLCCPMFLPFLLYFWFCPFFCIFFGIFGFFEVLVCLMLIIYRSLFSIRRVVQILEITLTVMWCFAQFDTIGTILKTCKTSMEEWYFHYSCRLKPANLLKISLLHEGFSHFPFCTNCNKSRKAFHISLPFCFKVTSVEDLNNLTIVL